VNLPVRAMRRNSHTFPEFVRAPTPSYLDLVGSLLAESMNS
jgi:hypothetical protein